MGLINNPTATLLEHVLGFRDQRHDAMVSNIANATTPGYKSFDLVLSERLDGMKPLAAKTTHPKHMTMDHSSTPLSSRAVFSKDAARLDGNNVSLEKEFMKMSENRMVYSALMELNDRWGALNPMARDLN